MFTNDIQWSLLHFIEDPAHIFPHDAYADQLYASQEEFRRGQGGPARHRILDDIFHINDMTDQEDASPAMQPT